ncbi:MAG: hypothetical protein ABFS14_13635 [Gemmatimonadota bacterium]
MTQVRPVLVDYRSCLRAAGFLALLIPAALPAQISDETADKAADETAVLALADSALQLISDEDFVGLTDLMLDEASSFTVRERDGVLGYRIRTRAEERAMTVDVDLVERGFGGIAQVQGHLATVWLPYDFYTDGEWSHCGVDTFTMLRTEEGWRIASLAWTVEQPPDCERHPDGPPASSPG